MSRLVLRPERFVAGGEAMARDDDGRVVFVRGALPDETVEAEVVVEKRDWARAVAVAINVPSPHRVIPPCPSRRAGCGGCGWQHLTVDAQRAARVDIVLDALRRGGGVREPVVEHGAAVPADGYRTTVRVAADADGRAGYRSESSHDVVAAPCCLIAHPRLAELLPRLRLDPDVELTLRVSVATGELGARWDRSRGEVFGLPADVVVGSSAVLHEDVAGHRLQVSMGSFFQSGPQAAEALVETLRRSGPELDGAAMVVDAYAGVGIFGVCATDAPTRLVAIESSRSAYFDARRNLRDRDADVVRSDVGGWKPTVREAVDVVVADPARSGLGKPGVHALTGTKPPVLLLVSCDPASLGRDAELLARAGYRHERSKVVDTFPHTTQVEVVSRFVR